LRLLRKLYGDVKREEIKNVSLVGSDVNIDWTRLSESFTDRFSLMGKKPVGEALKTGFYFKLNHLNYYPIVPLVNVVQKGPQLEVSMRYDLKSRALQYYWISIFVICMFSMTFLLILELIDPPSENNPIIPIVVIFFILVWIAMLFIFSMIRRKLWKNSFDKTNELLECINDEIFSW